MKWGCGGGRERVSAWLVGYEMPGGGGQVCLVCLQKFGEAL